MDEEVLILVLGMGWDGMGEGGIGKDRGRQRAGAETGKERVEEGEEEG